MKNNFKQKILKEKEFDSFSAEFLYNTLKTLSENKRIYQLLYQEVQRRYLF